MDKLKIKEAIVVEGRDDAEVVGRAADALIIETHGFGISRKTWLLLEKAYDERGLIILTDPDFAGEELRRRLTARFPNSRQAYMPRGKAMKKGDIGVENASPQDVAAALTAARFTAESGGDLFDERDMEKAGLAGRADSRQRREAVGELLGIGGGNGKAFLKKLNRFGIEREQFEEAVSRMDKEAGR